MHGYSFRESSASKSRGFSSVAIIILAFGIRATTAIFSVVNAIMLRGLPYADPERIVMIWGDEPEIKHGFGQSAQFSRTIYRLS
jgi:hypothetical protein